MPRLLRSSSVFALCFGTFACNQTSANPHDGGDLRVGVLGEDELGNTYRLRDGVFDIVGPSAVTLSTEDSVDPVDALSVVLSAGNYTVALGDGWRLERFDADTGDALDVDAELTSDNPSEVQVNGGAATTLTYAFFVADVGPVTLGDGTLDIDIDIDVDPPDELPAGWQGPLIVYDGVDDAPPCPGAVPQLAFDLATDLIAPDAMCDCSCGDPAGVSCDAPTLSERGNSCFGPGLLFPESFTLVEGDCVPIGAATFAAFTLSQPELDTGGASCSPNATEAVDAASFGRNVRACELATPQGACDGGCGPAPTEDFDQECIYFEGDAACPDGDYSERTVAFHDFVDDRSCSECTCGTPTGTCDGTAFLTTLGCGMSGLLQASVPAGGCQVAATQPAFAQFTSDVNASCEPDGGTAQGQATPTGAVTFCCLAG